MSGGSLASAPSHWLSKRSVGAICEAMKMSFISALASDFLDGSASSQTSFVLALFQRRAYFELGGLALCRDGRGWRHGRSRFSGGTRQSAAGRSRHRPQRSRRAARLVGAHRIERLTLGRNGGRRRPWSDRWQRVDRGLPIVHRPLDLSARGHGGGVSSDSPAALLTASFADLGQGRAVASTSRVDTDVAE